MGGRLTEAQKAMLRAVWAWKSGAGLYLYPEERGRARALIKRGLLAVSHDDGLPPQFVSITDAGRAALASMEAK